MYFARLFVFLQTKYKNNGYEKQILLVVCHHHDVWSVCLYGYIEACTMQLVHKRIIHLQRRFTPCQYHKTALVPGTDGRHDICNRHLRISREVGIAERTPQITATEAYEDSGATCMAAFAL